MWHDKITALGQDDPADYGAVDGDKAEVYLCSYWVHVPFTDCRCRRKGFRGMIGATNGLAKAGGWEVHGGMDGSRMRLPRGGARHISTQAGRGQRLWLTSGARD